MTRADLGDWAATKWRSSKNTKRWCKGKVGVKHKVERRERALWDRECAWVSWRANPADRWASCTEADVCVNCGKKFYIDRSECHLVKAEKRDERG